MELDSLKSIMTVSGLVSDDLTAVKDKRSIKIGKTTAIDLSSLSHDTLVDSSGTISTTAVQLLSGTGTKKVYFLWIVPTNEYDILYVSLDGGSTFPITSRSQSGIALSLTSDAVYGDPVTIADVYIKGSAIGSGCDYLAIVEA